MDDWGSWDDIARRQEEARQADEKRMAERERRRVARELGLEYTPIEAEPVVAEPDDVVLDDREQRPEPEPEFDIEAVKAVFQKLIDAVTRR